MRYIYDGVIFWYSECMKYIGLDVGTKKIGIAISDEGGVIAFPRMIKKVDRHTAREIVELFHAENACSVILGESKNNEGENNSIMEQILDLKTKLEFEKILVILEREFFTTAFARTDETFDGLSHKRKENLRGRKINDEPVDDKAAALILQRFLDRKNKK